MKKVALIIAIQCIACVFVSAQKVNPNPSFQKLISGATRVVIRDGDASRRASLEHKVYFEVNDAATIKTLMRNMVFVRGAFRNGCDCNGHPGMDWYVGDKLVAITAIKHGSGIIRNGTIAKFTPASKTWLIKWLKEHGMTDDQLK
ncbi:hypothetical protein [Persicirhabdus sediminis]|uniref:Uncharacterized protein n=1 Tax=Persicirhabdus sediminis TaxID=454144 RepID=A0A8J7MBQ1_9BACT|nr:hypothetical protein [Persicirhabdus sediminis]MBK1790056.1 hypothetical protein [Persicirhabdus sediminis]